MSDLISRQAAIDAAIEAADKWDGGYNCERESCITEGLKKVPSAQTELPENWWKTDHGYMWLCPHCGLPVHSDFEECLRCGTKRQSAQPERKTGKWILEPYNAEYDTWVHRCGNCMRFAMVGGGKPLFNYCPNCGAKMEVEHDI